MQKNKLNELCQKNGWRTPTYTCIKEGQDHCPLFKASVVVNGATFASQSISKSSKSAQNDAATLALSQLTASREVCNTIEVCLPVDLPEEKVVTTTYSSHSHTTVSIGEPNLEKSMKSYLLCNKVRVYTSIPDKMLPLGTVMLPIGEDKWTVASLG